MTKKIIITRKQLTEGILGKKEIFNIYVFVSHMKKYIEQLLKDPIHAKPDDVILSNMKDIDIIKTLLDNKIVSRKERIFNDVDKDRFGITYKCEDHWMRKLKRLFSELFEQNIAEEKIIECEGGDISGGATAGDASVGQYVVPFGGDKETKNHKNLIKRSIYDGIKAGKNGNK